jgi:cardiolipin synthase
VYPVKYIGAVAGVLLLVGCASTTQETSMAPEDPVVEYREAYEVYPAAASDGVSRHLARSHTSAIIIRPVSSVHELGSRLWDHIYDWARRLEVRMVRFPLLKSSPTPALSSERQGMDLVAWEERLDRLSGRPATTAQLEFLIDGELFYSRLERAIDDARHSIDLQTYLFDNDDVARSVADRLRARSKEIQVRVMFDGLGTYLSHMAMAESLPGDSIPIDNLPRYLCQESAIRVRVLPNIWLSGNHVKSMIFDQRIAFVGGMNIGREYRYEWHDMMVRLEGKAVEILSKNFQSTWNLNGWGGDFALLRPQPASPGAVQEPGEVPVRLLYTLPSMAQIYRAQLEAIRRARAYIYIENAYFADDRILYELCRARKRGVDVRVIMPVVVNHKIMEHSNRIAINTLLEQGARVFMYPGMSHVKAAVYDGWACVGTANFDKLSLQINRELNLATSHPETVERLLEMLFDRDFKRSTEITEPVSLNLKDHIIELIADET